MESNKDFIRVILQALNDPGNAALKKAIADKCAESEEFEACYQETLYLWETSKDVKVLDELNPEAATLRFSQKLNSLRTTNTKEISISYFRSTWLKTAAAAAVIFGVGVIGFILYLSSAPLNYITKTTSANQIDSVSLSDGSKVYLAEGSSLRFPEKLKGSIREVFLLKGKGFFKVARDEEKPFMVRVDESTVTVLGTSFNLSTGNDEIELSVETGSVEFETEAGGDKAVVNAGSGLIYNPAGRELKKFSTANRNSSAWNTRELKFTDASLAEVFQSVERYYKVKIDVELEDSIASYNKLNATFKNSSLQQVLDVLAVTYPIQIIKRDSTILVRNK